MRVAVVLLALAAGSCTFDPVNGFGLSQCTSTALNYEFELDFVGKDNNCRRHISGLAPGPCCVYRTTRLDNGTADSCKVVTGSAPPSDDRTSTQTRTNKVLMRTEGWQLADGTGNPDGVIGGVMNVYRSASGPVDSTLPPQAGNVSIGLGSGVFGQAQVAGQPWSAHFPAASGPPLNGLSCATVGCARGVYEVHMFFDNPVPPAGTGELNIDECPTNAKLQINLIQ